MVAIALCVTTGAATIRFSQEAGTGSVDTLFSAGASVVALATMIGVCFEVHTRTATNGTTSPHAITVGANLIGSRAFFVAGTAMIVVVAQ